MLAELRDFLLLTAAGWWVGTGLIFGGIVALAVFAWRNLGEVPPPPRKLADPPPRWAPLHRAVPRIPGATRQVVQEVQEQQAGPVCPVCGGSWHAACPSKERTDETVQLPPVADLAPQFVALRRYLAALDETAAETDKAMGRLVDDLAGRDDCPLTTQEIPDVTLQDPNPAYAAQKRGDTVELSQAAKKILEAKR